MKQETILLLEDETTIREVLSEYILMADYNVVAVANGDAAVNWLENNDCALAVLDIMVPKRSGLEVLAWIHEHKPETAVIMLSALEDEATQLSAFNAYADDYVVKPVPPILLLKRIETILRRIKQPTQTEVVITERLVIKPEAYDVLVDGNSAGLTLSEFLLLHELVKNPGRALTREELITAIYQDEYFGSDRVIDSHVKNLRKKLPFNCIKTVVGIGYQYVPPKDD
ncbi:MAG: response regulator transcription factor [Fastidiosipilaceae bacterium]|jgi:DNA-binding response OmpR family regulator|nr:response regulator transcription factor [Clostridiaceae bacterium]